MTHAPASSLVSLRRRIARLERQRPANAVKRAATGHAGIDAALGGGLALGRLHEAFAAEADDSVAATGFTAMLACIAGSNGPIVWLREAEAQNRARLHGPGLAEIGLDPARLILAVPDTSLDLLRAAADVVRCAAVTVAVVELWRRPRSLDLTASRRLAMAAEASGVTVLLLRIAAEPSPTAAQTRWRIRASTSAPLAGNAPGHPALNLELMRQRGGPEGLRWQVEWNRDTRILADATTSLSGAVVPLVEHRPAAAWG